MSNYIVSDNNKIIGCYSEKIDAIIVLMDNIINNFNLYLNILKINGPEIKIPDINSFSITSIIKNSSCVKAIYKFCIDSYKLKNVITNEIEFVNSNSDNILLNYKMDLLKEILNEIGNIKNSSDLHIFIPNNALNTEAINNIIINSPKSSDLNCVDEKQNKKEENNNFDYEEFKREKEKKIEKEKIDEFKRRYESDKEIYFKLKDEINENNIPELFKDQYPIMKILDNMNILNEDNGFNFYYKKMCDILKNKTNIYSSMFNDSSYFYANKKQSISSSESEDEESEDEESEDEEIENNNDI